MGRVIRIGFWGRKRVGNTIGRVYRQKTARRIPGERAEVRTRWGGKPQGDMPAGATSL
jgi:hypothetical protein